jgi:RNA polymerase sigma-70 factor (ECF subfamily)
MKYREAADELDVPVGTVKSRVHSAVKRLGDAWEQAQAGAAE